MNESLPHEPSPDGLGPTGFDPSRWSKDKLLYAKSIAGIVVEEVGCFGLGGAGIEVGAMYAAALIWDQEGWAKEE